MEIVSIPLDNNCDAEFEHWINRNGLKAHEVVTKAMRKIDPDFAGGIMVFATAADHIEPQPGQKAVMIGQLILGDWSKTAAAIALGAAAKVAAEWAKEGQH